MITINKGAGLITGITATPSYLLQSYSKKKHQKNKQPKTKPKPPRDLAYFYYEPAKQKTWNNK